MMESNPEYRTLAPTDSIFFHSQHPLTCSMHVAPLILKSQRRFEQSKSSAHVSISVSPYSPIESLLF